MAPQRGGLRPTGRDQPRLWRRLASRARAPASARNMASASGSGLGAVVTVSPPVPGPRKSSARQVSGVDPIRWNDAGQITDFKRMVRPLKAVNMLHQQMGVMRDRLKQGQAQQQQQQ
jgi:hypothetical protein